MVQLPDNQVAHWPPKEYLHGDGKKKKGISWHQYDMHKSMAKFRWLCSGIGGGKTAWAVVEDGDWALRYPGCTGAIIVPDFRTWRHVVYPECVKWWPKGIWREVIPNELVEIDCGDGRVSKILIYSASNIRHVEKILGLNLRWFHIEEAGRMLHGERAWHNATGRLREDGPRRGGWVSGSPFGFGWLTDAFGIDTALPPMAYKHGLVSRKDEDDNGIVTDYFVRGAYTKWNLNNPPDYISSLLSVYGGDKRFVEQELYGGILAQTDMIFHQWMKPLHVIPHARAMEMFKKAHYRAGGVDWGDRTGAMTWGGLSAGGWEEGTWVTIGELYGEGLTAERMAHEATTLNNTFGDFRWWCDPASLGNIRKWREGYTYLGEEQPPVEGTVYPTDIPGKKYNQWKPGIDLMRVYLTYITRIEHPGYARPNMLGGARWYVSDECVNLINEMKGYRWKPITAGQLEQRENAIGPHHAIDTCRYTMFGESMEPKLKVWTA